jgi:hypothetical protein
MSKPATRAGYSDALTRDCERMLVTLLRGLGPWKDSVCLVGGLTPRYLVPCGLAGVPAHVGSKDVDLVVDLQVLTDTDAYHTLEDNLKKMGFQRGENERGQKLSWRWQVRTENGAVLILELLADSPDIRGGKVQVLPTEGTISALNIPHSSIVFDMHQVIEVKAELLGENGIAREKVRHANLVSFTCLKALAYEDRNERKDAHDLIYCLEHAPEGLDAAAAMFREALSGKHEAVIRRTLNILHARFAQERDTDGYRKAGPVAVAKFEYGESEEMRETRVLRQRQASDVIDRLLTRMR